MKKDYKDLVSKLTLEEKAALCSGISNWQTTPIERLGIPSIYMADGPHGVRREIEQTKVNNVASPAIPSTCFPPAVTLASTWDRNLIYKVAEALSEEAKSLGVSTLLGPGVNIKRNPLCGRNFEYFSEDPYLTAELSVAYTKGLQDNNIGVSVKHYAVNSQEYMRLCSTSELDERTLREIYLYAFEKTVKEANPYTIMCSYNLVNGEYASEHKKLLSDILKEEWGFKGVVISDWGAVDDRVKGIEAGLHIEMPSSEGVRDKWIVEAVQEGKLREERLDEVVAEILDYVFKCDSNMKEAEGAVADYEKNHALSRKAATEGSVLLKNNDDVLPIKDLNSVAVVGELAEKLRMQGTGSSRLQPRNEVSFLQALNDRNVKYSYAKGYDSSTDKSSKKMFKEAIKVSSNSEYVILFIGLTDQFEAEGYDRSSLRIPKCHYDLIDKIYEVNKNIIVVLTGGAPVEIPNINKVKALLNVYLTGEAGGEVVYDLITGASCPSGKLAETFPINIDDVLSSQFFAKEVAEYRESIFVGYRYFDTAKKEVAFPFGHGLSYAKFEYSNLKLSKETINENEKLVVTYNVKNIGSVPAKEICQLYVRDLESTVFKADKELKGFDKIDLLPGETKTVEHILDKRSFAFYNVESGDWDVESGEYEILIGASSRDIRLSKKVVVNGSAIIKIDYKKQTPSYFNLSETIQIPIEEFESLLGRKVPVYQKPKKGEFTFNTCIGEFGATFFSKIFKFIAKHSGSFVLPKNSSRSERKMVKKASTTIPIRNFYAMTNGTVSYASAKGILQMLNGQFFRGLGTIIKGAITYDHILKRDIYPPK